MDAVIMQITKGAQVWVRSVIGETFVYNGVVRHFSDFQGEAYMITGVRSVRHGEWNVTDVVTHRGRQANIERFLFINNMCHAKLVGIYDVPLADLARYVEPVRVVATPRSVKSTEYMNGLEKKILDTYPSIRLEKTLRKRKETVKEFLIKFFDEYNEEKNTILVDTKEVQTESGRRRSLGDIFMILRYYYPDVTLKEVVRLLHVDLKTHYRRGYRSSFCDQVKRRMYYVSDSASGVYNESRRDEFGILYNEYEK